jgi:hypothetical protein
LEEIMDIKDVRVGDRCWASWRGLGEDEHGQNATVISVTLPYDNPLCPSGDIIVKADANGNSGQGHPGRNIFWTKPEAPPRPKRKVTKTFKGWMTNTGVGQLESVGELMGLNNTRRAVFLWEEKENAPHKCTITVEVEE